MILMELDEETIKEVVNELSLFRLAERKFPDMKIGQVRACACIGPLPECKCKKRERLVAEFIREFKNA